MIYLDHAATTPIYTVALEAMEPYLSCSKYGNPSSIHTYGLSVKNDIEDARASVADLICADPEEIYFTSGGTEANNAWLQCLKYNSVVAMTQIEHHSVLEATHNSPRVSYIEDLKVNADGSLNMPHLSALLDDETKRVDAVTVMMVNNEIGTINNISEISALCKKHNVLLHTDAVQAVGHDYIDVHKSSVDFLSLSGHKFGAPAGIGALYIPDRVSKRTPFIYGGGQEKGLRGGTQNILGIIGLGAAAKYTKERLSLNMRRYGALRDRFLLCLHEECIGFTINEGEVNVQNIISLTIPGVHSEMLLLMLDKDDIYVSAGSACSASDKSPSHVLVGIGMTPELASSTIRVSFGCNTTEEDVKTAAKMIAKNARIIRAMI